MFHRNTPSAYAASSVLHPPVEGRSIFRFAGSQIYSHCIALPLRNSHLPTILDDKMMGIIDTAAAETTGEVIARLDAAELEILDVLNGVGECLSALPRSIVSWDDCGLLKVHVMLKRLSERTCYNLDVPIDFHTHPFLVADLAAASSPM